MVSVVEGSFDFAAVEDTTVAPRGEVCATPVKTMAAAAGTEFLLNVAWMVWAPEKTLEPGK